MKRLCDEHGEFAGEMCFLMVLAPFVLALGMFGCSLAVMSGRLLFDLVSSGGRVVVSSSTEAP